MKKLAMVPYADVVRLVRRQTRWTHNRMNQLVTEPRGEWLRRADLLAALTWLKKGTP